MSKKRKRPSQSEVEEAWSLCTDNGYPEMPEEKKTKRLVLRFEWSGKDHASIELKKPSVWVMRAAAELLWKMLTELNERTRK